MEAEMRSVGGRFIRRPSFWLAAALVAAHGAASSSTVGAADDLHLAPGLSFTDDSSDSFPIRGDHMEEGASRPGRATVMFFGASHCWNTNREAERLVALYPKYRGRVSFIVVDVNHPSTSQRVLLDTYYRGSIPTLVITVAGRHTPPRSARGNGEDAGRHAGPRFPDDQSRGRLIRMHARTAWRCGRHMALVVILGTLMASGAHAGTDVPPQRKRALLAWLKAGTYQSAFTPEPEPHTSMSAHGPYVRTWYSPMLTEDPRDGRSTFRRARRW